VRITGPASDYAPAWSPDGAELAFTRDVSAVDATDVLAVTANGHRVRDLTLGFATYNMDPAWSPNGRRIALAIGAHGGAIAVMNADGTSRRALDSTSTGFSLESPSWSPDGRWIVYSTDFGNGTPKRGIFLVRPNGRDSHQILDGGFDPQWSPNGDKIAYAIGSDPDAPQGITVMNADGSGSHVIVNRLGATHPRWSLDGRLIAYTQQGKRWNVYTVRSGGGMPRLAVRGAYDATWRPPVPLTAARTQRCR